ncbi:interferon-induced GTP-binding protein Mx1 [Paraphaeosphaeria minitans]|uniref:Interferon-induced GTP-binding protein Mx1 n=1 Tax=Paraphaeosphaeria minitans TaxID=565426 RepID=A0A9P6G8Y2_9PLEO|nr:interferon-induced GTP-binding protein Mx1 [Paraphaeosphaeria minitans]
MEQERFLTRLTNAYQQEVREALSGNYDAELEGDSLLKLRMHIRKLGDSFAECMARSGHAKKFQAVQGAIDTEFARSNGDEGDIMESMRDLYRESRGAELPGTINPRVLENMFRQQSSPLKSFANDYIERINAAVHEFNETTHASLIPDENLREKLKAKLCSKQNSTFREANEQVIKILYGERGGTLQTVNHYFADTLNAIREERMLPRLKAAGLDDDAFRLNITEVVKTVHLSNENQAVNDIHDLLKAYYKLAIKLFAENVVLQVTERCLQDNDGPVKILSPEMVRNLQDDDLTDIASENFATSSIRNELTIRFEQLQKALEIAKQATI